MLLAFRGTASASYSAMSATAGMPTACRHRRCFYAGLLVLALLGLAAAGLLTAGCGEAPAEATPSHALLRGLWDDTFVGVSAAKQNAILNEISNELHVDVVRLMVFWARAEPQKGVFDDKYLATVKQAVTAARAHGLKVILTTYEVPLWASDASLWKTPPGKPFKAGQYQWFYAPRADAIPQYGVFARHIAQYFKGQIFAYECWNEPNMWWFLYPQQTPRDKHFAERIYLAMLKQYYAGVKSTDPGALVLGGNSCSQGLENVKTTSPLTWALWLKEHDVLKYCDAYSHHVYALGNVRTDSPATRPHNPKKQVNLANIDELLSVFPHTDFYLTEMGYNSQYSNLFGGAGVGETKQALYLTQAFALAAQHPQIKLLMWYLRVDVPATPASGGYSMFTGLRRPNGSKKPAWWAFAGGNQITAQAPSVVSAGKAAVVSGRVTHDGAGVPGIHLALQVAVGAYGWRDVQHATTDAQGNYKFLAILPDTSEIDVAWPGVTTASPLLVVVK